MPRRGGSCPVLCRQVSGCSPKVGKGQGGQCAAGELTAGAVAPQEDSVGAGRVTHLRAGARDGHRWRQTHTRAGTRPAPGRYGQACCPCSLQAHTRQRCPGRGKPCSGRREARCCPAPPGERVLPDSLALVVSQRPTDHTCSRDSDIPGDEAAVKPGGKTGPSHLEAGQGGWQHLEVAFPLRLSTPARPCPPSEYLCFVAILMVSLH